MRFPLFTSDSFPSSNAATTSLSNEEGTIEEDLERFRQLNSSIEKDKPAVLNNNQSRNEENSQSTAQANSQQPANAINQSLESLTENVHQLMQSIKFPLKKVVIGTRRTTLVMSDSHSESDRTLILSIFNLITLRGAQMDIPNNQATEITLEQLFHCLEKSFLEYNPKLKPCKIRSLLLRLYNTGTVDFHVTGSIDGIDNELIDKLLKWVKIYFVQGTLVSDADPLFDSLKGMKYFDIVSPSTRIKNSKKAKDIQDFIERHSDLSTTKDGLTKLHNTESMRLKILLHEDRYSVIVNYKGRVYELIDSNYLDKHPAIKAKYEQVNGNIPPFAIWAKWPLHNPSDRRTLCGGDFFEISHQSIEEIVLDDPSQSQITNTEIDPTVITCPISMCLFFDPVVAADNVTYEKEVYRRWCSKKNEVVSPVTGRRITTKFTNDVVIRNKVQIYLQKNIHLKLSEDYYIPKYAFEAFRKAVIGGNTEDATVLCKEDIRLIIYKPEEIKKINEDVETEDSLTGYNLAFMYNNCELLNNMKDIITENMYLALQQNSTSTVEILSFHLDAIESKISDFRECNKVKLQSEKVDATLINA